VVAANAQGTSGYDESGNIVFHATDPLTPDSKARPLGAFGWEIQVDEKEEDNASPWVTIFSAMATRNVLVWTHANVAGFAWRYRVRWCGPLLQGGAPNCGPWSAWQGLVVPD
jgi:hypothetical protein